MGITDSAADGLFGGWAQTIYLEPGVSMAPLPAGVPPETYISGGCGLITAVHAVDRAALTLGDTVLVQGTGAVGLSAIALARLAGATRVIAFGAPADRLELATAMGADRTVDVLTTTEAERAAVVREATDGLGVDVGHFVRALRVLDAPHAAVPWRAIGRLTYALSELNQALADAEAMRLPKALVRPNAGTRING